MAGHPGEGSQDRAAKAEQLERDCQRNTARTGIPEGRPAKKRQSEQDSQDRAARTGQPGQNNQDKTAIRTGQPSGQGTQNKIHCKTDESHAPHKFTKMQSGPMTNVISPNNINIRIL
jgi:hypothetical protein